MNLKDIVPVGFLNWKHQFKANAVYKGAHIHTPYIDLTSKIAPNVTIAYGCDVGGVEIGEYSYIEPFSFVHFARIGKYCSIGRNVQIGGWQHDYKKTSTNPKLYRNVLEKEYNDDNSGVVIENDVWVGSNAIILKRHIGNGAVIGAGAIVTHDVPHYAIVAGNPAKILGFRFEKDRIDLLMKSQWWMWDEKTIKESNDFF